jgi:hypothetical protein
VLLPCFRKTFLVIPKYYLLTPLPPRWDVPGLNEQPSVDIHEWQARTVGDLD